jgi:hypothetical protein
LHKEKALNAAHQDANTHWLMLIYTGQSKMICEPDIQLLFYYPFSLGAEALAKHALNNNINHAD